MITRCLLTIGMLLIGGSLLCQPASAGTTKRVSIWGDGQESGAPSFYASISADGRFVAFNVRLGESGGHYTIHVRDRLTATTETFAGNQDSRPSISADGRFVAFDRAAGDILIDPEFDVFLRDRLAGTTEKVSVTTDGEKATGDSFAPFTSADGRFVAFHSDATNLVAGGSNGETHVFVRDRQSGTTEIVSVDSNEAEGNDTSSSVSISADGRFVAFQSDATDLVTGDSNGQSDVFVRDRQMGTTERVSLANNGDQANSRSYYTSISADGRFVAFTSLATNLVAGDTNVDEDVFLRDRLAGTTERVSVDSGEAQANGGSRAPSLNADGAFVAFHSLASNLVPGDTNGATDVFLRDRLTGTTERISVKSGGGQASRGGDDPAVNADGRFVAFASGDDTLVPGDTNDTRDIFLRDRNPGPNDLLVDFGSRGLWQLMHNLDWPRINRLSPLGIAVGDLNGNGEDEAIAAFSDIGLWARFDNASWTRLHSRTSNRFIAGNFDGNDRDDLAVDFGDLGLWARLNNATWTKLHNGSPQDLAAGDLDGGGSDELIGDFGSLGLWVRYNNADPWVKRHGQSPLRIATGDLDGSGEDELIAYFNGLGLFARFNDAGDWVRLHGWLPEALATGDLDGEGRDELLADFGSNGLWAFYNNAGPWVKLHNTSPLRITTTDIDSNGRDDAIASFPGLGLYARYNNAGAWVRLHSWAEEAIAAGGFD